MTNDWQVKSWNGGATSLPEPFHLDTEIAIDSPQLTFLYLPWSGPHQIIPSTTFHLWFILRSGLVLKVNEQKYLLDKNKFLFLPVDAQAHCYPVCPQGISLLAIQLPLQSIPVTFRDNLWAQGVLPTTLLDYTPGLRSCLQLISTEINAASTDEMKLKILFNEILKETGQIISQMSREVDRLPEKKRTTREELYKRLCVVRDFIYTFYAHPVTLPHLARISLINPYYLIREYKNIFGLTPMQAVIERRMEVAYDLITQTELPITSICHDIGYKDICSFSKLFKSKFGQAPLYSRLINKRQESHRAEA